MIVQNFRTQEIEGRKRVSAEIVWEDNKRPSEEIYYEVDEKFSEYLECNPNAFFLATIFPAYYYGEKKYSISERICPFLYNGTLDALAWIQSWFYRGDRILNIDVKTIKDNRIDKSKKNAACFLSGGIDSYATLFNNRMNYEKGQKAYIETAILAYGLELDNEDKFKYVLSLLQDAAKELALALIPVYTNIYLIYRDEDATMDFYFWKFEYQGAALASIAHILNKKIDSISIAATHDVPHMTPYGSHPLLDPNYGSQDLQVFHDGIRYSRLDKTKIVSEHYPSPIKLRVCNHYSKYEPNSLNCGECEKCIRTMIELLVLDDLKDQSAFPHKDVTAEMIYNNVVPGKDFAARSYRELISPLKKIERYDLVDAIEQILYLNDIRKNRFKSKLFKMDRKFFEGKLLSLIR